MFNRTKTTRALAMILLTMTIVTPILIGVTASYSIHQGVMTPSGYQPRASHASPVLLTSKWNYTAGSPVECSPAIADVDGDGKIEVIVGSDYGLVAVNSSGKRVYTCYSGAADPYYPESPGIADLYGNGRLEVLNVISGYLYCYNGTDGTELWYAGYGYLQGSPAIGDLDSDGRLEVVVGDYNGYVYSFNGTNGNQLWQYPAEGKLLSSPTLADITGDGKLEVLVHSMNSGGYDSLHCLNATANADGYVHSLWDFSMGQKWDTSESSPAVADIDNDGHMETVVGSIDNATYCISSTGTLKWSYKTGDNIHSSPTMADIDGDGKLEILIGSNDHRLYCLDSTGKLKWSYTTGDLIYSSAAVADIDGDRMLEVLVGSHDHYLYCLNRTGGLEWRFGTSDFILSSPTVADIDGDYKLEVVFGSSDGNAYCLSVASAPIVPSAYPWPSVGYREDIRHTGCITDSDKDGLTDGYEITVGTYPQNPDTDGDGFTDYQEFLISTNPFAKEWQSYPPVPLIPGPGNNATMPGSAFAEYHFTMSTTNATGVVVTSGNQLPPGVVAPPSGTAAFLYLQISGTQVNGTTGAAIYLYYDRSLVRSLGVDELAMQIHRWNATTLQWDAVPSKVTIINSTHGLISARLNHFSYFAVFGTSTGPSGSPMALLIIAGTAGAAIVVVLAIVVVKKRSVVVPRKRSKTRKTK
ncbi:MAG: FG-GAP-like repeat-containing protein [Promethearchaeati archaeon SRVP18_Atabeyarchaeia-1]